MNQFDISDRQPDEQILTSKEIDNVHVMSKINCTNYFNVQPIYYALKPVVNNSEIYKVDID